jgi:hypothetical protein
MSPNFWACFPCWLQIRRRPALHRPLCSFLLGLSRPGGMRLALPDRDNSSLRNAARQSASHRRFCSFSRSNGSICLSANGVSTRKAKGPPICYHFTLGWCDGRRRRLFRIRTAPELQGVEISDHLHVIRCEDCGNEEEFNANEVNARATAIRRVALRPCQRM